MQSACSDGLKLDLTENTPDSLSAARLPNLLEHATSGQLAAASAGVGEYLSCKLPNVVEGSMDYGTERRSSRYLDFDSTKYHPVDGPRDALYNATDSYDRGYSVRTYDRKFDRENVDGYDNGTRYDRRADLARYQESDLDAPYRTDTAKRRHYDGMQTTRKYPRDYPEFGEYGSRYAEQETLRFESKKDYQRKVPETIPSKGYESGVKTRESTYELNGQADPARYNSNRSYGTLPRYEANSKSYVSYDTKYQPECDYPASDTFETPKFQLTSSKSYDRTKYDSRYNETGKSYEQTLKIGEGSSTSTYPRKQNPERDETEKMNGYRKNNFEAYGVYSDPEDDHGFITEKKGPQYTYKGVVVNVSGESSVVDQKRAKELPPMNMTNTPWCCRPTILLLLLVLLVVIFVLVAGILLYFNYMSYKPRHPVIEGKDLSSAGTVGDACQRTYCSWGANCVVTENGRTRCECPTDCHTEAATVCGSDGVTYASHCHLRRTSCQNREVTRVKHQGPCETKDPCATLNCTLGSKCVRSRDGRTAKCECLDSCPNVGDHDGSGPVCGTDGIDYPTLCDLNRVACSRAVNITVAFRGKCDPCAGVNCTEPEVCQLDGSRQPACHCGEQCGMDYAPVCGSDGKTYSNECNLRQEACRSKLPLRTIYSGICSSGVNPCDDAKCGSLQQCAIDKFGIARCECGPPCDPVMRPVCAKGGNTYPSLCELKRQACLTKTKIEVAYAGSCGSKGPCLEKICQKGAVCAENGDVATCECPTCTAEFQPVCGNDGISYGNECKLRLEACQRHRDIRVLYPGLCNGCESKKCDFYAECESDSAGEAHCVCPDDCEESTQDPQGGSLKVCGSNGVTYPNECGLKKVSCETQTLIVVAYKGGCELCTGVECEHGARCVAGVCVCPETCPEHSSEPVCGSDAKTYPSECELQRAACGGDPKLPTLQVTFYGDCGERFAVAALTTMSTPPITQPVTAVAEITSTQEREACKDIHCDFEATCELGPDKFPRCSCRFDCAAIAQENMQTVCGSDLRTYPSLCAMKMEACQRQQELRIRPLDLCQGMEVKPCKGDTPLVDENGNEYDCGNGPERKDCPSNYYCHQTSRFARCCKKEEGMQVVRCVDSWHGCCPDNKTAALGPDGAGCPSQCNCNKLGSVSDTCDPESGQCECKPGVGGEKCDRCMPGYWGLPKINSGHQGCTPCGCSLFGSVREDCEQMTGRCVCKPDIRGQKCTICTDHNKILTHDGCQPADAAPVVPTTCSEMECYSGGNCVESNGSAHCECPAACPTDTPAIPICGSDGQTYDNECELRLYACRQQADIVAQAFGHCRDDRTVNTDSPARKYTAVQYTQPAAAISPLSKSTRHLMVPEPDPRYYYTHRAYQEPITIDRDNLKHAAAYRPTPSTIRVVTALLGDLCTDDRDCTIPNSECIDGGCICADGFAETSDRQECFANYVPVTPTEEFRACLSYPCHVSSTCIDLPSATFVCICRPNYTGLLCDEEINKRDYEVASFDGKSYVRINKLKGNHKFTIDIEFKTYADNGILMYDQQQPDGAGDFVSLAVIDGYVVFKYNLGNGPVVLTSPEKVSMKTYHRVAAKTYHKDGVLILNEGKHVAGKSSGVLKSLNMNEDTYIGNVPTNYSRVYENIGTKHGLLGCIRKLKINQKSLDLHIGQNNKEVLETYRIKECEKNACANMPCKNGATCQPIFEDDLCDGHECDETKKKGKSKRKGDSDSLSSNINIIKCKGSKCTHLEPKRFKKNSGKKPIFDYESDYDETYDHKSHALEKYEPPDYRCICPPQYAGRDCEESLDPCMSEPCQHGATCDILPEGDYVCKCPPGRTGDHCETLDAELTELLIPELSGDGYLELPCLEGVAKAFSIELWFLTRAKDGLLLYNGQLNNGRGDFISLNLVHGKLEFRFNLGSGIANITTADPVALDTWHYVRISRLGREGVLQLNDGAVARGLSGNPLTELNLEMPLYVGGVKHWREVHRLAGAWTGLVGAIQRLMVNDKTYQNLAVNVTQHNTEIYDGLPCPSNANPCHNGGVCLPLLNSYLCKCATGFNGLHCEFFVGYDVTAGETSPRPVRFDGDNYLQFKHRHGRRRKGLQSNKFELRLRTIHPTGIIAWMGRSRAQQIVLALQNGHVLLAYTNNNQQISLRSKERIDDGAFHHIKAARRRRAMIIHIDGRPAAKLLKDSGPLTTNGKLFVGGKPGHKGIKACVSDLVVDRRRVSLTRRKIPLCHDNDV